MSKVIKAAASHCARVEFSAHKRKEGLCVHVNNVTKTMGTSENDVTPTTTRENNKTALSYLTSCVIEPIHTGLT